MNPNPSPSALRPAHLSRASRRLRSASAVCALLLCFAFVNSAFASGPFCSIAFSPSTGRYGHGEGYSTRAGADSRALSECGTYDARVVAWAYHGYVALAVGDGRYGTGYSTSLRDAKRKAVRNCGAADAHVVQSVWAGI